MARVISTLDQANKIGLRIVAVCRNKFCRQARTLDLHQVIEYVGSAHPILPQKGKDHFSERLRCPKCKQRGAFVWSPIDEPVDWRSPENIFTVRAWYDQDLHFVTIATANSITLARAAYEAAIGHGEARRLTLQHGARVIFDSGSG